MDTRVNEPVLSGEITKEGVLSLLSKVEELRTSGIIRFEVGDLVGEVELVAGQLALDQTELSDGSDPVEVLLGLRKGHYLVFQKLPPLPVSHGDERHKEGSLAIHVPADLMRYCEAAGLTGKLTFKRDTRSAEAIYDGGELSAIRVDGSEDADLHDIFAWDEGTFAIAAHTIAPKLDVDEMTGWIEEEDPSEREPTIQFKRRKDDTSEIFLRSVEVALSSIVEEREKRRGASRTSPPMPPSKRARRPSSIPGVDEPKPKRKREPTVRIVYLGTKLPTSSRAEKGTRHVKKGSETEEALPEASKERREPTERMRPAHSGGPPATSTIAGTLAWVLVLFVMFIGALLVLAALPPLE